MIKKHTNGTSIVLDVTCDFPGCENKDSVFFDTREQGEIELIQRGWKIDLSRSIDSFANNFCPDHKESPKMLKTRYVEISKMNGREYERAIEGEKNLESNWIVLKWFHHSDFESQEELNDQSENFTDEIARDTDSNRPLRIMEISHENEERRATYKRVKLVFPLNLKDFLIKELQ